MQLNVQTLKSHSTQLNLTEYQYVHDFWRGYKLKCKKYSLIIQKLQNMPLNAQTLKSHISQLNPT